jgi:hypothetical protein
MIFPYCIPPSRNRFIIHQDAKQRRYNIIPVGCP